jgi:hypothetical protein
MSHGGIGERRRRHESVGAGCRRRPDPDPLRAPSRAKAGRQRQARLATSLHHWLGPARTCSATVTSGGSKIWWADCVTSPSGNIRVPGRADTSPSRNCKTRSSLQERDEVTSCSCRTRSRTGTRQWAWSRAWQSRNADKSGRSRERSPPPQLTCASKKEIPHRSWP